MWMVRAPEAGMLLFAQPESKEIDFCLPAGVLVGVLGLGIWAILKVKRWREEDLADTVMTPEQQLERYQQMLEDGTLDPEEFAQIKTQLEIRLTAGTPRTECMPPPTQPPDPSGR